MMDYTEYQYVPEEEVQKYTEGKINLIIGQDMPGTEFNEAATRLVRRKTVEEMTLRSKTAIRPDWLTQEALETALKENRIVSDIDDLIDYYNRCLNEQQRHQILVNIYIYELMDDIEEFDGSTSKLINPYTGEPYKLDDTSMYDHYVELFFKKLRDMSAKDQSRVYMFIAQAHRMNARQLIDTTSPKNYIDAIYKDALSLSDLLMEATDGTVAESTYMTQDVHDKLMEASELVSKAVAFAKKAEDSKETKLYSMSNDSRYFGTVKSIAMTAQTVIAYFNDLLNKLEKQEVYEQYVVNDRRAANTIDNERLAELFYIINGLTPDEHAKLLEAFEFWNNTGRGELIDVSNPDDVMTKMSEQADGLFKRCADRYVNCMDARTIKPGYETQAKMFNIAANAVADVSSYIEQAFERR